MITIKDEWGNDIHAGNNMKMLGFVLNSRWSMDSHLSKFKSRIGLEYSKLKPYMQYLNMTDRKTILNSKLRSILNYSLPLYMGKNQQTVQKL